MAIEFFRHVHPGAAVTLPTVIELAGGDAQPAKDAGGADLAALRPAAHQVHHVVPRVMWHPGGGFVVS